MSLTVFEGLQSEIYVPITPKSIFTPVTKPLSEMTIALASACGAHLKSDARFNLAGDTSFREIPDDTPTSELMISHGGYDNSDANRDINCMFPLDRLHELVKEGFIDFYLYRSINFAKTGSERLIISGLTHYLWKNLEKLLLIEILNTHFQS